MHHHPAVQKMAEAMRESASIQDHDCTAELKVWADAVKAIASDAVASRRIDSAYFEDGRKQLSASFHFSAMEEAKAIQKEAVFKPLDIKAQAAAKLAAKHEVCQ